MTEPISSGNASQVERFAKMDVTLAKKATAAANKAAAAAKKTKKTPHPKKPPARKTRSQSALTETGAQLITPVEKPVQKTGKRKKFCTDSEESSESDGYDPYACIDNQ